MDRNAIPRRAVGSASRRTTRQNPSYSVDFDHDITESRFPSQPNRGYTSYLDSTQDERLIGDSVGDIELLPPDVRGLSTASGYTRVRDGSGMGQTEQHARPGTPKEQQTSFPRLHRGALYHFKAWWHEAVWCLLAVGLLIGLILLLRFYDRRPAPKWPNDLTLNTVVAIIATICRALTVIPVSEGLSQLKWNSFSRTQRPLEDLYTFDQASRGPFGSLALLVKARGRLLGVSTVAAVILVTGLATSSLTQATISLELPPEEIVKEATAKRLISFGTTDKEVPRVTLEEGLTDAAYSTILMRDRDRQQQIHRQLEPICPVGDCHWKPFKSLGICGITKNITSELNFQNVDLEVAADGGYLWASLKPEFDEDLATVYNITIGTKDYSDSSVYDTNWYEFVFATSEGFRLDSGGGDNDIIEDAILGRHDIIYKTSPTDQDQEFHGDKSRYRAFQWIWHWCVQEYEVGVSEGVAHTEMVGSTLKVKSNETPGYLTIVDADEEEDFVILPRGLRLFELVGTFQASSARLLEVLTDKVFTSNDQNDDGTPKRLDELAKDMALAMTVSLRDLEDNERGTIHGSASVGGLIVVVRWPWLSLLATQIFLTIVFLAFVILDTAQVGVEIVKSSNIAELMAIGQKGGALDEFHPGGIGAKVEGNPRGKLVKAGSGWNLDVYPSNMVDDDKTAGRRGRNHLFQLETLSRKQ